MRSFGIVISVTIYCFTYAHDKGNPQNDHRFIGNVVFPDPTTKEFHYVPGRRLKREAVGTLNIVTNNAQPIHADVKSDHDGSAVAVGTGTTDKPCPEPTFPSQIEPGTVFQVGNPTNRAKCPCQRKPIEILFKLVSMPKSADSYFFAEVNATNDMVQVTPPKEVNFVGKSLRKSWPLTSRLDLIRSLARIVTLGVLVLSGAIEFYPLIRHLYYLYYV